MSHEWTMKFIEHRAADRRMLRLPVAGDERVAIETEWIEISAHDRLAWNWFTCQIRQSLGMARFVGSKRNL
jgi:hypothetical protein